MEATKFQYKRSKSICVVYKIACVPLHPTIALLGLAALVTLLMQAASISALVEGSALISQYSG